MLRSVVLLVLAAACSLAGAYSPLMPELEPELLDRIAEDVAKIAVAKLGRCTSHARAASRNLRAGAALAVKGEEPKDDWNHVHPHPDNNNNLGVDGSALPCFDYCSKVWDDNPDNACTEYWVRDPGVQPIHTRAPHHHQPPRNLELPFP